MVRRFELRDARVLLTGATGGIGEATARALADRGASLCVSGRRTESLDALVEDVGGVAVTADLALPEDVDRLLTDAGDVDVLVANAALPASGALDDFTAEELDRAVRVNLLVPMLMARAVMPGMRERGRGHLVFIGSVSGIAASARASVYNGTKFGLRGFSLGLRQDLHGTGVGVSLVEPGFVRDVGMFADGGGRLPPGVRAVTAAEVASAVVGAIEQDRREVVVAPLELRTLARVAGLLPGASEQVQRLMGAEDIAAELAQGQRTKR